MRRGRPPKYSIVDAEPKSVLSDRTIAEKPAGVTEGSGARRFARRRRPRTKATSTSEGDARPRSRPSATSARAARRPRRSRCRPARSRRSCPRRFSPQLATLVSASRRATAAGSTRSSSTATASSPASTATTFGCLTRRGNDWSARMPGLVEAVRALGIGSGWLDGEIVVNGANGTPDFNALQNAFDSARTDDIQYYVFDLPYCERPRPAQRAAGRATCACSPPRSTARRRSSASASARTSTRARRSCSRTRAACASRE